MKVKVKTFSLPFEITEDNLNLTSDLTASGDISASGNIITSGDVSASGDIYGKNVYLLGYIN